MDDVEKFDGLTQFIYNGLLFLGILSQLKAFSSTSVPLPCLGGRRGGVGGGGVTAPNTTGCRWRLYSWRPALVVAPGRASSEIFVSI